MEWTDIFSGPAFEPVKSRELHLGKDCDLSRPLVVRDTDKLTVEVAGGAALRLVVLHTKPCQAEVRIAQVLMAVLSAPGTMLVSSFTRSI